ncbi:DUF4395 domain-containing protein [Carboxylicivirga linearis]|uniref:DUF4395 domain-containing protein n=1 Tax=Carboxylicivirga linearis TaxID=1628157 RepID=A0ABS5JPI3_9BACT|nr:DUF4395 domain-containing protein [Carboxylicivirga linearis]MBS2096780.1 DUF4395 domain-containing protein [Carboxylicivirga linearis]
MSQFGEKVEGYTIPVLNEREIRASAGILFLFAFISIMTAILKHDMVLLKYFILGFFVEFIIRLFINPKYAPTLIIGRWIVSNQVPEYVGAKQKKFAWTIGFVLAIIMLGLIVVLNSYSIITGLICLICLIFLFFESAFGICLGCLFYKFVYKEKAQYCPGEVCEVKDRHEIQKSSFKQVLIVIAFIAYIVASVYLFSDAFNEQPRDLWEVLAEKFK